LKLSSLLIGLQAIHCRSAAACETVAEYVAETFGVEVMAFLFLSAFLLSKSFLTCTLSQYSVAFGIAMSEKHNGTKKNVATI
jgi:hypothetical protein